MKTFGILVLVSLMIFLGEVPGGTLEQKLGRREICPTDRCICLRRPADKCTDDSSCKGGKICCFSCCTMRCVNPKREKPGKCPRVPPMPCLKFQPDECKVDAQCPRAQKCCERLCNRACVNPIYRYSNFSMST
ncbi:hypothetical protein JRQ81_014155 [Phrynocephalus forsythii]|uniref:WAP domain-containing protein n=1 Tax=Phrynocephalus forsythii TaxID=171643 RepID=A0A9Q0XY25_9SAUR|nr:hypothetical protein JRQ81_014155 [Phrynocephalus forsythii]